MTDLLSVSTVLAGPTSAPDWLNHRWPTCCTPASAGWWLRDHWPECWHWTAADEIQAVGARLIVIRARLMWQETRTT
jgi:hypothetical protein